jgi:hypothetical protein
VGMRVGGLMGEARAGRLLLSGTLPVRERRLPGDLRRRRVGTAGQPRLPTSGCTRDDEPAYA